MARPRKKAINEDQQQQSSLLADYVDTDWVIESLKKSGYQWAVALVSYKNHFIILLEIIAQKYAFFKKLASPC